MLQRLGLVARNHKHAIASFRALSSRAAKPPRALPYSKPAPRPSLEESTSPPKSSFSRYTSHIGRDQVTRYALRLLQIFLIGHLISTYVVTIRPCIGPSMLPTINWEGDWILISKFHRRGYGVNVGDLVSYYHPIRQGYKGVKRVVGMPGDFVLRDTPGKGDGWMVQVPEGHCWLAGDNLDASRDSRHFGPLPLELVRGKVLGRVWPKPGRLGGRLEEVGE